MFRKQFNKLQNACAFAEAIVNTVREPLVVLDQDLRVVAAQPLILSDVQGQSRGYRRQTAFRVGRRRVGYSKASITVAENLTGGRRSRGR